MPWCDGLPAIQMAYQLNPRAAASARLCPASESNARLWANQPDTASTTTKSRVSTTAAPMVRLETSGGSGAWL